MAKYIAFWKPYLKKLKKQLAAGGSLDVTVDVSDIAQVGDRDQAGYNGYLRFWAQQPAGRTASQVFADLQAAIEGYSGFMDSCPGEAEFRITGNNSLRVTHKLLTLDAFIQRYKSIQGTERVLEEKYKWQLIQANLGRWRQYEQGGLSFSAYFLGVELSNLIYPIGHAVIKHVVRDKPTEFETLLLALYDEGVDLSDRLRVFTEGFRALYASIPDHGANNYMDERTVALLLTWRYPGSYTLFKDSFYTPLCKALGLKTKSSGQKLVHYYAIIKDLVTHHLPKFPEVIAQRDAMLDATCYPDTANMILAQDILYKTIAPADDLDGTAQAEERELLETIARFSQQESHTFLQDVEDLVRNIGIEQGDERVHFSCRPGRSLALVIGQRYCIELGSDPRGKHGFILAEPGDEDDVDYGEYGGADAPSYGHTDLQARAREHWNEVVDACRTELARSKRSGFRDKTNQYFEQAVFDPAYRAKILGENHETNLTSNSMSVLHPLNTILYGPPGTGKTYHAITHAVAIVDGEDVEVVKRRPREQVRKRYDELLDKRLVRTVTFHQSFSYEDFIEGIKPQTHVSKDGEEEVKLVTYEVQDGIFKLMCASARTGEQGAAGIIDEDRLAKANFYKVSLGQYNDPADDEIYAYCMANNVIAVGYGGSVDVSKATDEAGIKDILKGAGFKEDGEGFRYTVSVLRTMHLDMKVGDIVLVSAGNSMVRAIGRVSGGYFMDENAPIRFKEFLKVDWLVKDAEIPVEDLYPKNLSMGTLYSLDRNLVKKDYFRRSTGTPEKRHERYVLIIDEINRGNVASIFGELITLIEDDKRDGGKEPAKVKLPYSKKEDFSVPSNLYLLGTMNTADRSVEALDTALRRRFSFVEMASQAELVEPTVVGDVDLRALLRTINERVEQLLDKDHHIGHSYFMGLQTADDLKRVFATKVIPLLEEYFHGDAKKVGAILGEAFVEVRKKTIAFAKGFEMDDYEVKELYTVNDPRTFTDLEPFKAIYAGA
jgi:5-methylcytosine-specific restriction protein B